MVSLLNDNINIYNGDCLEILKNIPDNSIDMILTDCPYKFVSGGCTTGLHGILAGENANAKKGTLFDHNTISFSQWLPEIYRVVKPKTHTYIMVNGRNLAQLQKDAEKAGFKFVNLLVWKKNNATANRYYMNRAEFILMLRKGGARTINNPGTTNVLEIPNIIGNKSHPAQKPV